MNICNSITHCRWMLRCDLSTVLAIEADCFRDPWTEEDILRVLRIRNCIGLVATVPKTQDVIGYIIYELHKTRLHLMNMAVAKGHWRSGVGSTLVECLTSRLRPQRRQRLVLEVRESNVDAQLFFRALGFRAISVLRNFYEDTPEDAYVLQYRIAEEAVKS